MATPIEDNSGYESATNGVFATHAAGASANNAAVGVSAENDAAAGGSADKAAANPSATNAAGHVPPPLAKKPAGLPSGKYKLVGWDIDTTRRKSTGEIFQIAAYAYPEYRYTQYIMPHRHLNPETSRRHNVQIFIGGRSRMLIENVNKKVVKTMPEIVALTDFLSWLEEIRSKEMIILMYHDDNGHRLKPTVLIQSLNRYRLFDRFKTIVAGFTDSYALCVEKCKGTINSLSLEVLARLLVGDDVSTVTASERAVATYKLIEQLGNEKGHYPDEVIISPSKEMMELAREFARPISTEVEALESLTEFLKLYN